MQIFWWVKKPIKLVGGKIWLEEKEEKEEKDSCKEVKMVGHRAKSKNSAKKQAMKARKKGFEASIYKKKKGYGVSVTRK